MDSCGCEQGCLVQVGCKQSQAMQVPSCSSCCIYSSMLRNTCYDILQILHKSFNITLLCSIWNVISVA